MTDAQLKRRKLELECEKLEAETREAVIEADRAELEHVERAAAAHRHRVYPFIGALSETTVSKAMTTLDLWRRRDPGEPITVVLNSPGGSVIDGLALYDFLLDLRRDCDLSIVCRGYAASMGGILLQAGDYRLIGANAHMLVHEPSRGTIGKLSELEDDVDFMKKLAGRLAEILAERSSLSARQIMRKWDRKDWWLDAGEAVQLGFADAIG